MVTEYAGHGVIVPSLLFCSLAFFRDRMAALFLVAGVFRDGSGLAGGFDLGEDEG